MTGETIGKFGHDYSRLVDVLKQRKTRYVYIPNPGNAGDALIAANTYRFFSNIGLDFEIGGIKGVYDGRDVVFGGGGNLIEAYTTGRNFLEANRERAKSLVVLPHTIRGHSDVLSGFGARATFFAREQESLDYLKRTTPGSRVEFCHDMALYADPRALITSFPLSLLRDTMRDWRHPGMAKYHLWAYRRWKTLVAERHPRADAAVPSILNAYRTDVERTDFALPVDNIDLSDAFMHLNHDYPPMVTAIVRALYERIEPVSVVRTNRLHVLILAALMGKTVEASDNSYGKLGAIYDASLKQFSNISLSGA